MNRMTTYRSASSKKKVLTRTVAAKPKSAMKTAVKASKPAARKATAAAVDKAKHQRADELLRELRTNAKVLSARAGKLLSRVS
jgi:hypothetical protein